MIARIEIDKLPIQLSSGALANLALLQAVWGNRLYPDYEVVPKIALSLLSPELGAKIAAIAAEHFPIVDHVPGPNLVGNEPTEYQFEQAIDLAVTKLEHVRNR